MALRTTVVGSWWKLDEHEDQLARYHRGELDPEQGDDLLNRAAAAAIDEQRALGLDEWTGGEYFTDNFIDHMQRVLHGFEIDKPDEPDPFDYDDLAHAVITGELSAPQGLGYAAAYRRESKLPGGVRKATVVGPLEITVHAQDQREELARQMPNLIGIVNREIRELADAGCPHVQLDVPFFGMILNEGLMGPKDLSAMVAGCFEGVDGVTRGMHICNGNFKGRPISPIVRNASWVPLLQELDGVIDIATPRVQLLRRVPGARGVRRHAAEHGAGGRHRGRGQLRDRDGQEDPRPRCRLGAGGGRGAALDLTVVRLRAAPRT